MKKIAIVLVAFLFAGSAVAADSAFQGFYGQISAGYENNSVGSANFLAGVNPGTNVNAPSVNSGAAQVNIGVGYNFPINETYLLGFGAEYSAVNSNNLTTGQLTGTGCGGSCGAVANYQVSNRYSVFLTPSYVVNKDSLAYLKVGYSSEKVQSSLQETSPPYDANNNASFGSSTVNGYVLGFGYKQMVQNGFYGFGEANYYNYSSASLNNTLPTGLAISNNNPSPSAYNIFVGIGYKF